MRQFYDAHITPDQDPHVLSEEESKHIIRVLRMKEGDRIGILNGKGSLFECEIIEAHPKKCLLKIVGETKKTESEASIHIAVAPTKQMERIEWFIEKATEIGITEISLIECKNGERSRIKTDRLRKKMISAMKQSKRFFLPQLNEPESFKNFIEKHPNGLIAHCYNEERFTIKEVFEPKNCPIVIGPEGDFTLEEIELALQNGYKTITLGENRLRTETAALYACMQAKLLTE